MNGKDFIFFPFKSYTNNPEVLAQKPAYNMKEENTKREKKCAFCLLRDSSVPVSQMWGSVAASWVRKAFELMPLLIPRRDVQVQCGQRQKCKSSTPTLVPWLSSSTVISELQTFLLFASLNVHSPALEPRFVLVRATFKKWFPKWRYLKKYFMWGCNICQLYTK